MQADFQTRYGNYPDAVRGATGMFGPSNEAPEDAPALDRIAAYFGRTL
ncbi:hypothetical protein [Streptomyces sp. NPDC048606]